MGGADKMRIRAVIPHRAIIHDIGASVWAEPDVGRTVEPIDVGYKRLVVSAVAGKVLDPQGKRQPGSWLKLISVTSWPIS